MKQAISFKSSHSQRCALQTSLRQLCLLVCLVCLIVTLPVAALPQTNSIAPAPLPLEAQAAIDKGVLAAKQQDFLLAIRYFQDARKLAPQAPEIYYDLGLAESKIPGRELRAIAWFGAYLVAKSNAPNEAAVNDFIAGLQIKNQGNINRLIKTAQDSVSQTGNQQGRLDDVARLWLEAGDLAAALKTVDMNHAETNSDLIASNKSEALSKIAAAQAKAGDFTGAQKTFESALQTVEVIQDEYVKSSAQTEIVGVRARAGDFTGAEKTLALIRFSESDDSKRVKSSLQSEIAEFQVQSGDTAGAKGTVVVALKIANSIRDPNEKCTALTQLVQVQAKLGDIAGAKETLASAVKAYDSIENKELKTITAGGFPVFYNHIADAQLQVGDVEGAKDSLGSMIKYADFIQDPDNKYMVGFFISSLRGQIDHAQAEAGSLKKSASSASPTAAAQSPIQPNIPVIKVSDWVNKLDDEGTYSSECPLNTPPFLDLAGYLTAQHSDDPNKLFSALKETADKIIKAQNVIDKMLKQQAGK